jgi:TonB family protein
MKSILFSTIVLLASTLSLAQTQKNVKIFLDSTWNQTTEANHTYIRVIEDYFSEKDSYIFKDLYKSNVLQMVGSSTTKDVLKQEGQFIFYYENGKKKTLVNYSKAKKIGKEYNWYENGNLKSEIDYFEKPINNVAFKVNHYWNLQNEHKVVSGNGEYQVSNKYHEEIGQIKNGFYDGIWTGKNKKPYYTFTERYENGKLVSGTSTDSLNTTHSYKVIYQNPLPKNGIDDFHNYIRNTMYIPPAARNKISGKIYLSFIVDPEGNLVEPKLAKGIGYGIDESAIDLIKQAKKWNPGVIRGVPSRILYSIPITILN